MIILKTSKRASIQLCRKVNDSLQHLQKPLHFAVVLGRITDLFAGGIVAHGVRIPEFSEVDADGGDVAPDERSCFNCEVRNRVDAGSVIAVRECGLDPLRQSKGVPKDSRSLAH